MIHKWSGWPGAFCQECGNSDPFEDANACRDCDTIAGRFCDYHKAFIDAMQTCPPTKEAIQRVRVEEKKL